MSTGDTGRTATRSEGIITINDSSNATVTGFVTFTDGDVTPDVSAGRKFRTGNTSAKTITNFDGVTTDGYEILVMFGDDYTTVAHSSNIDMPSAVNRNFLTNDMMRFTYYNGTWYAQEGRMD